MEIKSSEIEYLEKLRRKYIRNQNFQPRISDIVKIEETNFFEKFSIKQNLLKDFTKKCNSFRQIQNDGNSFYRAIGFQYLESIFKQNRKEIMLQHIQNIKNTSFQGFYDIPLQQIDLYHRKQSLQNILIIAIKYLYMYRNTSRFSEVLMLLFNDITEFDFAMILYIRQLTYQEFDKNQFILQAFYTDQEKKNEMLRLQTYGEDAINCNFEMVQNALKINICVHIIEEDYRNIDTGNIKNFIKIDLFYYNNKYYCSYNTLKDTQFQQQNDDLNIVQNSNQIDNNNVLENNNKFNYIINNNDIKQNQNNNDNYENNNSNNDELKQNNNNNNNINILNDKVIIEINSNIVEQKQIKGQQNLKYYRNTDTDKFVNKFQNLQEKIEDFQREKLEYKKIQRQNFDKIMQEKLNQFEKEHQVCIEQLKNNSKENNNKLNLNKGNDIQEQNCNQQELNNNKQIKNNNYLNKTSNTLNKIITSNTQGQNEINDEIQISNLEEEKIQKQNETKNINENENNNNIQVTLQQLKTDELQQMIQNISNENVEIEEFEKIQLDQDSEETVVDQRNNKNQQNNQQIQYGQFIETEEEDGFYKIIEKV